MKALCDEITRRFPEVLAMIHEVDDESAYLFMGYLAEWLCDARPEDITPQMSAMSDVNSLGYEHRFREVVDTDWRALFQPSDLFG